MTVRTWLLLGVLSVLWGSGTFFNRVAVQDAGPMTVVLLRVGIAALVLWLVMRVRGVPVRWRREDWVPFTVMGVLNTAVPFTLIALGLMRIDSGLAGILLATTPLFTMVMARMVSVTARLNRVKVLGVVTGMAGVVVIMGEHLASIADGSGLAKLAILGAALAYGGTGVYGASLRDHEPLSLAWGQLSVSTLLLAPIAIWRERPFDPGGWSTEVTLSILALALLSTVLRYLVFYRLLAEIGATRTSMVGFLIPASSVVLGCLFLGERLQVSQIGGMVLVVAGLVVANGGFQRDPRRQPEPVGSRASPGRLKEPGVKWG
jgi:drug/metabolite transporter (DMT)-like permease